MDKVVLISIPETTLKNIVKQAVSEALSGDQNSKTAKKTILNFDELCDYIGISKSYGYSLTSKNLIPFSKKCGKLFFSTDEIDNWLLSNKMIDQSMAMENALNYTKASLNKR